MFVRHPAEGVAAMDLVVEGVHCGACISTIEKGLGRERGVRGARVNLASKRVTVEWDDGALEPSTILDRLSGLGYPAYPFAAAIADSVEAAEEKRLLKCLGVAAFGAMNVMLISVALWSGAADGEGWATRDFFHWLSALVALPTRRLCRAAVLRQRAARAAPVRVQHGRADHHRRHAGARAVGGADAAARARDLFRQRGRCC